MEAFCHILNMIAYGALIATLCSWGVTSTFWWLEQNEHAKLYMITRAIAVGCSVITLGLWILVFLSFEVWVWP